MNTTVHVIGIDPGLVDTGIVFVTFNRKIKLITLQTTVITRGTGKQVAAAVDGFIYSSPDVFVFIEGYRSRSNFSGDARMIGLVREIKNETGGKVLNNTGIKKVVKTALLDILQMRRFSTLTHHADLESAARILVLGMLKDDKLNGLLSDIVKDYLAIKPWDVVIS